jgi:polysaccharide export outer membrane protein
MPEPTISMQIKESSVVARIKSLLVASYLLVLQAPAMAQEAGYAVQPGDLLSISVWKEPDLQGEVLVTPDGAFAFPLVGQVDARGKTVTQLQKTITEQLTRFISDPVVTVSVRDIRGNKVYVIGQVNKHHQKSSGYADADSSCRLDPPSPRPPHSRHPRRPF